jgi:hypothetical protein
VEEVVISISSPVDLPGVEAMTIFEEWLSRKLARGSRRIRESRTIKEEYSRIAGPRSVFAQIVLSGEPSDTFAYRSEATWPIDKESNEAAVLHGILDELLIHEYGQLITGVRFTLHSIKYHHVHSSPAAFYHAARGAVRKIVDNNVVYP